MRLARAFYYIRQKWLQRKKDKTLLKQRKSNKTQNECFIHLMVYYANTFHPILTYINDATKFALDYEMEKEQPTTLCMCHDPGGTMPSSSSHGCRALIFKSKVAWGLSISIIFSKWPPIGVMQQSHAMKWWDLSFRFVSFHFPYGVILTDNRGHVPYTLHAAHTCEYGLTS